MLYDHYLTWVQNAAWESFKVLKIINIYIYEHVNFVLSILIVFNDYEQKIITKQINNKPSMKLQSWRGGMYNYNIK